jgi:hypothetical protein
MLHSPAHWPLYGLPETSLLLKVDHYMLHVRIFMRTDGCAIFLQNTDTDTGVGGSQEFRPRVHYQRYGLPDIGVSTRRFKGRYIWSGPQGPRDHVLRL